MYTEEHSITFIKNNGESKNTWNDWFLIPSQRPVFAYPSLWAKQTVIPGRIGYIDLVDYLTINPVHGSSTGTLNWIVDNDHGNWPDRYSELLNWLHGKRCKAILSDDPEHYYEGRFKVDWQTGRNWSEVTMEYYINKFLQEVEV